MELVDAIAQVVRTVVAEGQPAELFIGTVTSVNPLAVMIDSAQADLREEVLYLTDAVIERKITAFAHTHTLGSATTTQALGNIRTYINGQEQAVEDNTLLINKGLSVGDKVLLLAVQKGQKFIILSHLN